MRRRLLTAWDRQKAPECGAAIHQRLHVGKRRPLRLSSASPWMRRERIAAPPWRGCRYRREAGRSNRRLRGRISPVLPAAGCWRSTGRAGRRSTIRSFPMAVPSGRSRSFSATRAATGRWLVEVGVASPFAAERNRLSRHAAVRKHRRRRSGQSDVPSPFTSSNKYGAGVVASPRSMALSEAKWMRLVLSERIMEIGRRLRAEIARSRHARR